MSSYRFDFALEFYATERGPSRAKRERAAKKFTTWLKQRLAEIAERDRSFADQLTAHLMRHVPRPTATGFELVLTERKGAGVAQQACIHSIQRWLRRHHDELEADEVYWQVDDDEDVAGPFAVHDGRIARVVHRAKTIVLETDVTTAPLPSAGRMELRRAWQSGVCSCPGCSNEMLLSKKLPAARSLTELARRGGQHDKLAKLAQKWWDSTGHKLDDAKFKVQGQFIPAREAFEKYATKTIRNAEGASMTNVWSSVTLANWAAR